MNKPPWSMTRTDDGISVGRFSGPLYNAQNIPRKDTMPITADELRIANHHLDQAIESLRLALHCTSDDKSIASVVAEVLRTATMTRELTGVARRTRQSIDRNRT